MAWLFEESTQELRRRFGDDVASGGASRGGSDEEGEEGEEGKSEGEASSDVTEEGADEAEEAADGGESARDEAAEAEEAERRLGLADESSDGSLGGSKRDGHSAASEASELTHATRPHRLHHRGGTRGSQSEDSDGTEPRRGLRNAITAGVKATRESKGLRWDDVASPDAKDSTSNADVEAGGGRGGGDEVDEGGAHSLLPSERAVASVSDREREICSMAEGGQIKVVNGDSNRTQRLRRRVDADSEPSLPPPNRCDSPPDDGGGGGRVSRDGGEATSKGLNQTRSVPKEFSVPGSGGCIGPGVDGGSCASHNGVGKDGVPALGAPVGPPPVVANWVAGGADANEGVRAHPTTVPPSPPHPVIPSERCSSPKKEFFEASLQDGAPSEQVVSPPSEAQRERSAAPSPPDVPDCTPSVPTTAQQAPASLFESARSIPVRRRSSILTFAPTNLELVSPEVEPRPPPVPPPPRQTLTSTPPQLKLPCAASSDAAAAIAASIILARTFPPGSPRCCVLVGTGSRTMHTEVPTALSTVHGLALLWRPLVAADYVLSLRAGALVLQVFAQN